MKFHERIGDAIKQSGYTQKQIAAWLEISPGNITNWKKGVNMPSLDVLYKLCVLLTKAPIIFSAWTNLQQNKA